jgi:Cu-Zn family superoxide dismutase
MPALQRLALGLLAALVAAPALALAAPSAARARLLDAQGKEVGIASFEPAQGGVTIDVKVSSVSPGKHGFHVHEAGKCEPPDFKSAGAHFNPGGKKHGHDNPEGAHAGDLPNLQVGADGRGTASFVAKGLALESLFQGGGTALVLHADPDDGKTDPSGNSGARIACGVIERGK